MRQRVMIAIGLACNPKLIIADEPTTALDVTIQAQILELMKDLSRQLDIALIIITHNLGIVARYADRVNVMYAARIAEQGCGRRRVPRAAHPYTMGLLRSVPRLDRPRGAQARNHRRPAAQSAQAARRAAASRRAVPYRHRGLRAERAAACRDRDRARVAPASAPPKSSPEGWCRRAPRSPRRHAADARSRTASRCSSSISLTKYFA